MARSKKAIRRASSTSSRSTTSTQSNIVVSDVIDNVSSRLAASSTPPTSHDDVSSHQEASSQPSGTPGSTPRRDGRGKATVASNGIHALSGANISTLANTLAKEGQRSMSGQTLVGSTSESKAALVEEGIEKLDMDWTLEHGADEENLLVDEPSTSKDKGKGRHSSIVNGIPGPERVVKAVASASTVLGKRAWEVFDTSMGKIQELAGSSTAAPRNRNTQNREDSGMHFTEERPKKRGRSAIFRGKAPAAKDEKMQRVMTQKSKNKKYLESGLYVGQERLISAVSKGKGRRKQTLTESAEASTSSRQNKIMPMPMFAGERMIEEGRIFRMPFDVFSPQHFQPKAPEWKKLSKNQFVGDVPRFDRFRGPDSYCECGKRGNACDDKCHNRIMSYECDKKNCLLGADCGNRAFADLKLRNKRESNNGTRRGNEYDYGIQITKTEGCGYGVRAIRTFEPGQIIVEYVGEIITQKECDRRMNQDYKNNSDFYIMEFHEGTILDATRGNVARFVNHSCNPNCYMEKWLVDGEPRMALFAGHDGIMTGEELTYDYNWETYDKIPQACRCGAPNCSGELGKKAEKPKPGMVGNMIAGAKRTAEDVVNAVTGRDAKRAKKEDEAPKWTGWAILSKAEMAEQKRKRNIEQQFADIAEQAKHAEKDNGPRRSKRASLLPTTSETTQQKSAPTVLSKRTSTTTMRTTQTTSTVARKKVTMRGGGSILQKAATRVISRKSREETEQKIDDDDDDEEEQIEPDEQEKEDDEPNSLLNPNVTATTPTRKRRATMTPRASRIELHPQHPASAPAKSRKRINSVLRKSRKERTERTPEAKRAQTEKARLAAIASKKAKKAAKRAAEAGEEVSKAQMEVEQLEAEVAREKETENEEVVEMVEAEIAELAEEKVREKKRVKEAAALGRRITEEALAESGVTLAQRKEKAKGKKIVISPEIVASAKRMVDEVLVKHGMKRAGGSKTAAALPLKKGTKRSAEVLDELEDDEVAESSVSTVRAVSADVGSKSKMQRTLDSFRGFGRH